jgi:nicotinamide riboside kinase
MKRTALIGGSGCGKSTQCAHFFSILKSESVPIEQIQEWVREAFNKRLIPSPKDNPWIQAYIYEEQKKKEDCVPNEIKYIVTDSPTVLSYVYALKHSKIPQDSYLLIKMYENFINDIQRYDYIFLCGREKPYINDGTRFQTKEEAEDLDKTIINLMELHNISYIILNGTPEDRTKIMRKTICI